MTVSRIPNVEGGIQPTIVTAKGDLIAAVANASPGRLGVGSDGTVLTADSSSATGLSYQNNWAAGKNKIINGDFNVNQRSFSTTSTNAAYGFDRWKLSGSTGTFTYSAQTFTAGTAPVTGYEGTNFARLVTSGQTSTSGFAGIQQQVENVRTFANQTVTLSFWAKASSGTPKVQPTLEQVFGTSGSAGVQTSLTSVTLSTSWARYSGTVTIPSISGKTIGTSNYLSVQLYTSLGTDYPTYGNIGVQAATIDFWGVQLEAGSTATAFQTATGTIQGELAACQRYYYRNGGNSNLPYGNGAAGSTTQVDALAFFPTEMRTAPTFGSSGTIRAYDYASTALTPSVLAIVDAGTKNAGIRATVTGATQFRPYKIQAYGDANAYVEYIAEL
jgi:hypothetical protein